MRLVDNILRTVWRLLVILAIAFPLLGRIVGALLHSLGAALSVSFTWIGSAVGLLITMLLAIGIVVRIGRAVHKAGSETMGNGARGSRTRATARRRAEDVPAFGRRGRDPEDPDPTLDL